MKEKLLLKLIEDLLAMPDGDSSEVSALGLGAVELPEGESEGLPPALPELSDEDEEKKKPAFLKG